MKVVLATAWFAPDSVGGTENYVHALATFLASAGARVTVVAPERIPEPRAYRHEGVDVVRYPHAVNGSDKASAQSLEAFAAVLRGEAPDIYHQHALRPDCSLDHLEVARSLGFATISTVHIPDVVCLRSTMMRFGREACDGRIDARRCGACWLHHHGVARPLATLASSVLNASSGLLDATTRVQLHNAFRAPLLARDRLRAVHRLSALADRIVAVSQWLHDALLANGVAAAKLSFCRQSIAVQATDPPARRVPGSSLRVGYFGRGSREKGADTLVAAMRAVPAHADVRLDLHLVGSTPEEASYRERLVAAAREDPRIHVADAVPPHAVPDAMRSYDVIAVPSRWLETGPLVAMEALSVGVPVLGSDLGGIAELVEPGVTGWLLPPNAPQVWAAKLASLADGEISTLEWNRRRVPLVSHAELAERMMKLYEEVLRRAGF